jgi:hypothetical protein
MLPAGMLDAYPTYHGGEGQIPYSPGTEVGKGGCAQPELRIALNDLFIAARQPDGKLYDTSNFYRTSGFRAEAVYLNLGIRQGEYETTWPAPSLIRIESLRDPILLRLQKAIAAQKKK